MAKAKKPVAPAQDEPADITLENVGPVDYLKLSLKVGGGVTILCGENGAGKSETLAAVSSVLRGEGKPDVDVADGADRGEINVMGATLRVGKSSRRIGEMTVQSLEGRFDLSDLAAPPRKDPASADALAIKALVSLSGVKADASKFSALLPGEWDSVVDVKSLDTDDPVEMAARVKRQFERVALSEERASEHLRGQAEALERLIADMPGSEEADETALMRRLEGAIARSTELEGLQSAADMAEGRQSRAKRTLAEIEAKESAAGLVSPAKAREQAERAAVARGMALDGLAKAKEALATAEALVREAQIQESSALDRVKEAEARVSQRAQAEKALKEAGSAPRPTTEELEAAAVELEAARKAQSAAAAGREFRVKRKQAEALRKEAGGRDKRAATLRDAASATDDVLTELVQSAVLKVKTFDGVPRLVIPTKRGPATLYRDLSDGERWFVAVEAAVERLPAGGLLVLRQSAWEGLSPKTRKLVDDRARSHGVHVLTAMAADGELRAESFGGGN